jgi:hypothetical protein
MSIVVASFSLTKMRRCSSTPSSKSHGRNQQQPDNKEQRSSPPVPEIKSTRMTGRWSSLHSIMVDLLLVCGVQRARERENGTSRRRAEMLMRDAKMLKCFLLPLHVQRRNAKVFPALSVQREKAPKHFLLQRILCNAETPKHFLPSVKGRCSATGTETPCLANAVATCRKVESSLSVCRAALCAGQEAKHNSELSVQSALPVFLAREAKHSMLDNGIFGG